MDRQEGDGEQKCAMAWINYADQAEGIDNEVREAENREITYLLDVQ